MIRTAKFLLLFLFLAVSAWVVFISALPVLFIRQMEHKYAIILKGERNLVLFTPRFKVKNASFVWNDKVELLQGNFDIQLDPLAWIRDRVWAMSLQGDGSKLRFLGEWLKKTGVSEIQTTRLRLALDFYDGDIREIHQVEVVAPDYQFQIQSRVVPK